MSRAWFPAAIRAFALRALGLVLVLGLLGGLVLVVTASPDEVATVCVLDGAEDTSPPDELAPDPEAIVATQIPRVPEHPRTLRDHTQIVVPRTQSISPAVPPPRR